MKISHVRNLHLRIKPLLASLILMFLAGSGSAAFQAPPGHDKSLIGRWQVNLTLSGGGRTNLEFQAQDQGKGSFLLQVDGSEHEPQALPATWSQTTNDRVNFSGEIEVKFSACCKETGTLIFRGKFKSTSSITGKAIFIATTENEENFTGYISTVGTFTATRMPDTK